jgi:alkyl hydroperoxide reductase subunit F
MYDLAILGGGPAGSAAAVYAARKLLKTVLITKDFGGQSTVSTDIQNWIGTPHLSGEDLAKNLEAHVRACIGCIDIESGDLAARVVCQDGHFTVTTEKGKTFNAKTVLVATGGTRKKLSVPGAEKFDNKGLTYCASCDGPVFSGQDVAVIGGGNAGFETAAQLLAYTTSVTLIHRGDSYSADPSTVEKVLSHPNMRGILSADILEVQGDKFVSGLVYEDKKTKMKQTLPVAGIFVEIGMTPATGFVEGLVDMDQYKRVIIDARNQRTSMTGMWAAGDCTNNLYHQNNIAAGDGVKALEDIYLFLNAH